MLIYLTSDDITGMSDACLAETLHEARCALEDYEFREDTDDRNSTTVVGRMLTEECKRRGLAVAD